MCNLYCKVCYKTLKHLETICNSDTKKLTKEIDLAEPVEIMVNKRLAVLVGCNYSNTPHQLHGCINDVHAMRDVLVRHYGFDQNQVQVLTDENGSSEMPTRANIKKALDLIVDQALPGDVLFFHFSGHGTRIPSLKPANPFRKDEAIVPCDFNIITDVDMRELVKRVPKGASFTIISDSCHSGGLIDKEKEQIGPSSSSSLIKRTKNIPYEAIQEQLKSNTGHNNNTNTFNATRTTHFALHGDDEGILLSGCQANETCADMKPSSGGASAYKAAYGAFSDAVVRVLKSEEYGKLSNQKLVMLVRELLGADGIRQHPCLYCSDHNADAPFLGQS